MSNLIGAPQVVSERALELERVAAPEVPAQGKFAEQLEEFVSSVDEVQKTAEQMGENFANGRSDDLHGTMITMEQANISLHLLANVRNRVIEAYREVMRMGA